MLGNIIGGFIVVLIGVTLAPTVANEVSHATKDTMYGDSSHGFTNSTISGSSATILDLTTLFYVLAVASIGIGIATSGLKAAGLMGA